MSKFSKIGQQAKGNASTEAATMADKAPVDAPEGQGKGGKAERPAKAPRVQMNLKIDEAIKRKALMKSLQDGVTLSDVVERYLASWVAE